MRQSKPPPIASSNARIMSSTAGHALVAALAVIPGEHERDDESDRGRDDQSARDPVRPTETLAHEIEHLDQRKRRSEIGERPLHDLALLESLDESSTHGPRRWSSECIAAIGAAPASMPRALEYQECGPGSDGTPWSPARHLHYLRFR